MMFTERKDKCFLINYKNNADFFFTLNPHQESLLSDIQHDTLFNLNRINFVIHRQISGVFFHNLECVII
jgi:cytochrome b